MPWDEDIQRAIQRAAIKKEINAMLGALRAEDRSRVLADLVVELQREENARIDAEHEASQPEG